MARFSSISKLWIAAHEAAHRIGAEQHRGIEHAQHEVVLDLPRGTVGGQHVVEEGEIRQADAASACMAAVHTRGARALSKGLRRSSVLATGSSIASAGTSLTLGCSAADNWM